MSLLQRQRRRVRELERRYGLSLEQYTAMLEAAGYRCAICRATSKRALAVDHCHLTGDVRGLLCDACNLALGLLGDDPDRIERAAEYVGRHRRRRDTGE